VLLIQSFIPSSSSTSTSSSSSSSSSTGNGNDHMNAGTYDNTGTALIHSFNDGVPIAPTAPIAAASFPEDIGSTVSHAWPPSSPTNAIPTLFPTKIGYAGATATGAEPGLVMTAPSYPMWYGMEGLVQPEPWSGFSSSSGSDSDPDTTSKRPTPSWIEDEDGQTRTQTSTSASDTKKGGNFSVIKHWGNLTPFHSVPRDSFGIHSSTGPEVPAGCELQGVHIVHRHGARYPTNWGMYPYLKP
jgi:hypothetical protein